MEFLLLLIGVSILYGLIENNSKRKDNNASTGISNKPSNFVDKEENQTIINNYCTQNNVYVQQNNYHKKSQSNHKTKGHSEKIWNKLGYRIKRGESYSYKYYGNEIFTSAQVEKNSSYEIQYSETGLAKKLLHNTGSKNHAKNILVNNYGLSKSKAENLLSDIY